MEHNEEIIDFLKNTVDLDPTKLSVVEEKFAIIKNILTKKYNADLVEVKAQGSWATDTIVNPQSDQNLKYDIDVIAMIKGINKTSPKETLEDLEKHLDGQGITIRQKNRGVSIDYGGGFHMDIVPCIKNNEGYLVCNREENIFEISDGAEHVEWFNRINEKNENKISKCIKLVKFVTDSDDSFSCPSVIFTILFANVVEEYKIKGSITKFFVQLVKRASEKLDTITFLHNPRLDGEDFLNRVNNIDNFKECIKRIYDKSKVALDETDKKKSIEKWQDLFGDSFKESVTKNTG